MLCIGEKETLNRVCSFFAGQETCCVTLPTDIHEAFER